MADSATNIRLVDSHLHLQEACFQPRLEDFLRRAAEAGVRAYACNGSSEKDWENVLQLARTRQEIIPCFGLHPWYVRERSPEWLNRLEHYLDRIPSAIGEIGLDRWIEPRDESAQEEVFCTQLALARKRNLPVMIHCVRAWGWLMDVLRREAPLPAGLLIHAYGGPAELIKPLAAMGAYFSCGGTTLDPHKKIRRETLPKIPADRLLLETDSPDLPPPEAYRATVFADENGKILNEPANLRLILGGIAQLLGEAESSLAQRGWENSRRFFGKLMPKGLD